MSWERLAGLVLRRPRRILALSLVILVPPLFALPGMRTSLDELGELPETADSVLGFEALRGSFDPGQVQPTVVIVEAGEPVWHDAVFEAIDALTVNLEKIPGVASVRSITRPAGGAVSEEQIEAAGLGGLTDLSEKLPRAERGLGRAVDGLERIRAGIAEIAAAIPGQRAGAVEGLEGIAALRAGVAQIRDGVAELIRGLSEGRDGLRRLADEVADPTLEALERAWEDLRSATIAKSDPVYPDLAENVGRALAAVSGRCPDATGIGPQPPDCPAGQKLDPEYDGLGPTLREVADGIGRAVDGLRQLDGGLVQMDTGLAGFDAGIRSSLGDLDRLEEGADLMLGGLDRIIPGLTRLRQALVVGVARAQDAGLLPDAAGDVALTASLTDAFPKLKRQLRIFVGEGETATRLFMTFGVSPFSPRAIASANMISEVARLSLRGTRLERAPVLVTGTTAFFADVADISGRDFRTIIWAVIGGIFLVLAILLRSVVAPFYLVLTVLLSFLSTLGITVVVFQGILGQPGLVWWLPAFLFVVLVALGADYNIFLTSRIREEAARVNTKEAVAKGLAATGHVITSAGLILAGTFAALLASSLNGLVQMGFAATIGILVDTFVVRSLLVPSIAVLLGRWSWWPSARATVP